MYIYIVIYGWQISNTLIDYINVQQIGFCVVKYEFWWGWAMDEWKLCYMETETEQYMIITELYNIHMWDIVDSNVL